MKEFQIRELVLSESAAQMTSEDDLALVLSAGIATLQGTPDGAAPGRVGIGVVGEDVGLREVVDIYFHVGEPSDLTDKHGGMAIPLVRQYDEGVRNVIRWAAGNASAPMMLVQHQDVAGHAQLCASSYTWPGKLPKSYETVTSAAAAIEEVCPQIRAMFGTGFPFYCAPTVESAASEWRGVPESIITFSRTQADEFSRRLLSPSATRHERIPVSVLDAAGMAIDVGRFTSYEYTRWGMTPPSVTADIVTLDELHHANILDEGDRCWPCQLCTTLCDQAKFPEQRWQRDFMKTCLECNQTPFIPRAVGVLGSDIDLVAVIDDDADDRAVALTLATWIDRHPSYFRHDTRWDSQLFGDHGPLDVFVVRESEFRSCVNRMVEQNDWHTQTVSATVTWLPVTSIDYELGKYFALCMEWISGNEETAAWLASARARFASRVSAGKVLEFYEGDSFYLQQLAGNESVRTMMSDRFNTWKEYGGDSSR